VTSRMMDSRQRLISLPCGGGMLVSISPGLFYARLNVALDAHHFDRFGVETHRAVFTWVRDRLVEAKLLKGKTVGIDATTLEANAAMRSIVRRDTMESYQAFLTRLSRKFRRDHG
jgi:hypothetical protein